ncbi:MAG: S-layer homology domain-containing protein [Acidaminococcaceae bacterium]|nr:S-layer homology domain-containing protein [Acidaminococcaceae bacterium]
MKKSLVLAMAMALGVTASAYAANPFSDVPAGHWAYDSISKLAAAGIIEGYGDDTFRGDRLMTRYEMAQIVAKALAKGANVDKLAAEFADELDALGVRVAALEKKSDNVKITGEVRYHYGFFKKKNDIDGSNKTHNDGLRTRLYFTGKVNDNWNYVGRIENQQMFHDDDDPDVNHTGEDGDTRFNIAKLEGRLGGVNVVAGRDDDVFADGNIYDGEHDAIKLSYGNKWYVSGAYGKLTDLNEDDAFFKGQNGLDFSKKFYAAEIGSNIDGSFVNGKVGYFKSELADEAKAANVTDGNVGIFYVGANFNLAKDLTFDAMYLRANRDKFSVNGTDYTSKKDGYVFGLGYKGAEASEPGSWGLSAKYYHQGRGTYLAHTIDGDTDFETGFKGWSIGGDVTVAKNMVASVTYYDTKALKGEQEDNAKTKVIWSEFNVTF